MAKDKKVEQITDMEVDFAQWFTDVCKKAQLIDYSSIKGVFVYRPYGYAIWENMQHVLDAEFKKQGVENVYMPMLIPESLLQKEKDHVEGFAPECAWVTMGGSERLEEKYAIRPTSETLFCEHWANVVQSHRDLPMKYNQWCSVIRWEKTSRPFLRHREFLWQEGHTIHATAEEARAFTETMLNVYADFCENVLAMPVTKGVKTDKEKFNGAEATYTIECMMHDRKALQAGTSHYFGDGFARAFEIEFTDKNNQKVNPFETSWGVSTRLIGGIIMTHGDERGLRLPPVIAPIQTVILPIAAHKPGVMEACQKLEAELKAAGLRVKLDDRDTVSAGFKFNDWELKGVPARVEVGPRDLENGVVTVFRRDLCEKITLPLEGLADALKNLLADIQKTLYEQAKAFRDERTKTVSTLEELGEQVQTGFAKAMWCGDQACEDLIKEKFNATTRNMPFDQEGAKCGDTCVCCGKKADKVIYFAKAY